MLNGLLSMYLPSYPTVIVYMLQSSEYQAIPYLNWFYRTFNFKKVIYRRELVKTKTARLLLFGLKVGMILQILLGLFLLSIWFYRRSAGLLGVGLALIISYPIIWGNFIALVVGIGNLFYVKPRELWARNRTKAILLKHPAIRVAVAGSYGKTTMKELLNTILKEGKHVSATPANKNTAISHYKFVKKLSGREEVLVFEFGEGKPGDVRRFTKTIMPKFGFITGLAPAHLDKYRSVSNAAKDILSLAKIGEDLVFINAQSEPLKKYIKGHIKYAEFGAGDWKASEVKNDISGISFNLSCANKNIKVKSGLLGRHQIGPLSAAAAFAKMIGMKTTEIERGLAKTIPFPHRMETRLVGGGWVIDDSYNGNIEGVKVGISLLRDLKTPRRIYVTPGLVDQGKETKRVHILIGELLSNGIEDVVLMQNSVTKYIEHGLEKGHFKGNLYIQNDPLNFYNNLDQYIAANEVVLMQNDWTDNYA